MSTACNLLNQFAGRFKNLRISAGQVQAVSMISRGFVTRERAMDSAQNGLLAAMSRDDFALLKPKLLPRI